MNSETTGDDEKLLHDKPNLSTAIANSNDADTTDNSKLEDEFFGNRKSASGKTNDNTLDDSVRKTVCERSSSLALIPKTLI